MKKYFAILLSSFVILAFACESDSDNPCDKIESLGIFALENSSKDALPYQPTNSRVIFSDSLGQERTLSILLQGDGFIEQSFFAACDSDSSSLSIYEWEPERVCYELEDQTEGSFSYQLCLEMIYNLNRPLDQQVADILKIDAYSSGSLLQREGEYGLLLDPRNYAGAIETAGESELLDEFSWEGRTLNQVFRLESINNIGQTRELYYSKEQGLVAFRDYSNDTFYFFERIE